MCYTIFDGYYVEVVMCSVIGALLMTCWGKRLIYNLEKMGDSAFVVKRTSVVVKDDFSLLKRDSKRSWTDWKEKRRGPVMENALFWNSFMSPFSWNINLVPTCICRPTLYHREYILVSQPEKVRIVTGKRCPKNDYALSNEFPENWQQIKTRSRSSDVFLKLSRS